MRVGRLDAGVDTDAANERRRRLRALFTGLPAAVAVDVVPLVGRLLAGGVGVAAAADAGARVVPVEAVVALQHGLAVAAQVVRHADAGSDLAPREERLLGKRPGDHLVGEGRELGRPLRQRTRQLFLLWNPALVTIVAHAEVDRGAADRPRVGEEEAQMVEVGLRGQGVVGAQLAGVGCRREREADGVRDAVGVNVVDVATVLLQVAFPRPLLQQLGARLERVAALAGVEEVGAREVVLLAVTIELPDLVGALDHRAAAVAPRVVGARVGDQREVVAEVAVARFEVDLVAERAVPLRLVDPAARVLQGGLLRRGVGVGAERQAVGLFLLPPLVVADQLVLLVDLVGQLGHRVPQLRVEGFVERELGLRHRIELLAVGAEEPDLVLQNRTADVDVLVVVLLDLVAASANRAVVERRRHEIRLRDVGALQ